MNPEQQFIVAMIVAIGVSATALTTMVTSVMTLFQTRKINAKANEIKQQGAEIHTQGVVQHEMLNSGLAKLEEATRKIAYDAGLAEGRKTATAEGEAKASGLAEGLALPQSPALPQPEKP